MENRLSKLELYSKHDNLLVSDVSDDVIDLHNGSIKCCLRDPNNPTPSAIKQDRIHRIPGHPKQHN